MAYTPPPGKMIDHDRIGKKGWPRHWEALGLEPPLKDIPAPEPAPAPPS